MERGNNADNFGKQNHFPLHFSSFHVRHHPRSHDKHLGKLRAPSKLHRKVWCFFFSLSTLHAFYDVVQFIILLRNGIGSVTMHTAFIQLGLLYVLAAYLTMVFWAEGRQSDLLIQIFNDLYNSDEFHSRC